MEKQRMPFENEETVKVIKSPETGRYQVCMPNGDAVPLIVRDSVEILSTPEQFRAGFCIVKLEVFVKLENINPTAQEVIKMKVL